MTLKTFFIFCYLLFTCLSLDAQHIRKYNKLTQENGLLSNRVTAISEDPIGRVWIGTIDGINLYDGAHIMGNPKSMSDSIFQPGKIIEIKSFKQEMIIAADNGIYSYDFTTNKYRLLIKTELHNTSKALALTMDGVVILCNNTLYKWAEQKIITLNRNVYFNRIQADNQGNLWGATFTTVAKCDKKGNVLASFNFAESYDRDVLITSLYCDSKNLIWAGTKRHGILRFDPIQNKFKAQLPQPAQIQNVCSIAEDAAGRLWIGHNKGVAVFDYINQYTEYRMLIENFDNELNSTVCAIYKSKFDDMILGTYFNGAFCLSKNDSWLDFLHVTNPGRARGIVINNILMSSKKLLWVATNAIGINVYNGQSQVIKRFNQEKSKISDNIISLEEDAQGSIWAGSESNGLYCLADQGSKIKHYQYDKNIASSLPNNRIFSIRNFNQDFLLVGTDGFVSIYDRHKDNFTTLLKTTSTINDIMVNNNLIWICCLDEIVCYDWSKKTTKIYKKELNKGNRIQFLSMLLDGENVLLGTKQNYLYFIDRNGHLLPYPGRGKINVQIHGIKKDNLKRYWLSTTNGLYCVDTDRTIKNFNVSWGLNTSWFNERSAYYYSDTLYFGSVDGICFFKAPQLDPLPIHKPLLYFSDFKIFNISQLRNKKYFEKGIDHTNEIVLPYDQNMISIEVNQVNFDPQSRENYRIFYTLKDIDKRWYELSKASGTITFTSLKSKNYELHIKLVDLNNNIIATKKMLIKIKPHFLLSNIMLWVYGALVIVALILFRKFLKRRHLKILKIKLAEVETSKLEELNKSKLDFFTYMSHELKTPLAIIMAIQEDLFSNHKIENIKEYEISQKNIKRLTFLISQLMEFREIESSNLPLNTINGDLVTFCQNIFSMFAPLFDRKNIEYRFENPSTEVNVDLDFDKLEKIISNLLSNAFKNCEVGGQIVLALCVSKDTNEVVIYVSNTGSYIPQDQIEKIFEPYFRQKSSGNYYDNNGIGLALVVGLTKRINAQIDVNSSIETGTRFTLTIPVDNFASELPDDPDLELHATMELIDDVIYTDNSQLRFDVPPESNTHKILLVEDHTDLAELFKNKLLESYHVIIAHNGQEALEYIRNNPIDMVISDIMMPIMDGYELCKHLKSNPKTKHIPIILMTSYDTIANKIKSYELAANGYINKPFSMQELLAKMGSLLKNKATLRHYYSQAEPLRIKEEANSQEETFILKVQEIIVRNIAENNFSVHQLAQEMRISRTQLYLLLKKITDLTPTDFIIKVKLDYAKTLLKDPSFSISEIAYKLGYSNANYFSKQFKDFFGITPSHYRKAK
ncbi:response regulator [Sphingobacterium sp. GVS05A]|uniref:hybrid sensor histidine kinase/response regulator transcription factor n=1 Tax=Sphingobacterium sp. GVS05A TaxID=2862679 RepID=UPI001CBCFF37|nr:response regulator [Sphingobacterium sp. GVS05A]